MQPVREEIMPGVYLTCLQTDKFKTGLLSVNLLTRLTRDDAAPNALIPSVLRRGTQRYGDLDALSAALDSLYGARIEPLVRKMGEIQAIGFWADFIDDRYLPAGEESLLGRVTGLLGEMLLTPNTRGGLFLPAYVESEKKKLLEDIRARVNDKAAYSRYRLIELMFAAEEYGADPIGTESSAESIGYVSLTKRYRSLLASSPIEMFYCGSADAARVQTAVRRAFAALPRDELDTDIGTDIRMNTVEEEPRMFTEAMDVTQGKLAIGFRLGECMEDPDTPALRVMNTIYGGGVSSKLFMNVREKMSLCYYASSSIDLMKGVMFVTSGIEPANYETALAEIMHQLEAVRAGGFTDDELDTAKLTLMTHLQGTSDSPGELESFWLFQDMLGLPYGPEELAALIEEVTPERVRAAAAGIACDTIYFMTSEENAHEQD